MKITRNIKVSPDPVSAAEMIVGEPYVLEDGTEVRMKVAGLGGECVIDLSDGQSTNSGDDDYPMYIHAPYLVISGLQD